MSWRHEATGIVRDAIQSLDEQAETGRSLLHPPSEVAMSAALRAVNVLTSAVQPLERITVATFGHFDDRGIGHAGISLTVYETHQERGPE